MKDYSIVFGSAKAVEQLALNEVAKYTALKLIQKAITQEKMEGTSVGRE